MTASLPRQWLDQAEEDLAVARLVLKEDHIAHACFLSQQCIEKTLKGYLIAKVNQYPRTHNLVDLLNLCRKIDSTFSQFHTVCADIDQYYIPTRYPEGIPGIAPLGVPSTTAAESAIGAAERILEFVAEKFN
jgi:HEPN domain-containing protein